MRSDIYNNMRNKQENTGLKRSEPAKPAIPVEQTLPIPQKSSTIGEGTAQQIIESEILFAPPEKDRVIEIMEIKSELHIKEMEISSNTVCISGYIHKGIIYKLEIGK